MLKDFFQIVFQRLYKEALGEFYDGLSTTSIGDLHEFGQNVFITEINHIICLQLNCKLCITSLFSKIPMINDPIPPFPLCVTPSPVSAITPAESKPRI